MRKIFAIVLGFCFLLTGCDSLRLAPSETQKQNAWLHNRTTTAIVEAAREENTSKKLQELTGLSELQSRAFISYYGLPKQFPQAHSADSLLIQSNFRIAQTAVAESADRPDAFALADNVLELAIGVSALLGGVYGARAVRFLTDTRAKSKALQEVITGNELFKKQRTDSIAAFKQAHGNQSPHTRQIVAGMKA